VTLTVACSRFVEAVDLPDSCSCHFASDEIVDEVLDGVSDILAILTGFAYFGLCEATVRPCRGCWCGVCPGCCSIDAIPLRGPIVEVAEVKVDGVALDTGDYRVIPRNRLMRVSTGLTRSSWPQNQNVWADDTEDNTFSITYSFGHEILPIFVRDAAVELACEFLMSRVPNQRGKLPPGTTNVFFQGVQASMQPAAEAVRDSLGSLDAVSTLMSVTSGRGAGVFSPDGLDAWVFPLS
jgi:hypothetical protein